jgi:hypothetical protein
MGGSSDPRATGSYGEGFPARRRLLGGQTPRHVKCAQHGYHAEG